MERARKSWKKRSYVITFLIRFQSFVFGEMNIFKSYLLRITIFLYVKIIILIGFKNLNCQWISEFHFYKKFHDHGKKVQWLKKNNCNGSNDSSYSIELSNNSGSRKLFFCCNYGVENTALTLLNIPLQSCVWNILFCSLKYNFLLFSKINATIGTKKTFFSQWNT